MSITWFTTGLSDTCIGTTAKPTFIFCSSSTIERAKAVAISMSPCASWKVLSAWHRERPMHINRFIAGLLLLLGDCILNNWEAGEKKM
jgi:hypothetical protein